MTKQVYIFGDPVAHSKSPDMHNAAYKALGLDFNYSKKLVSPSELGEAVKLLRSPDCAGANITVPHKENVLQYLDEIDPLAKKYGAVNTIVNTKGKLKGYNTDGPGYVLSLEREKKYDPAGKKVALIGSGGAARAIAFCLAEKKCKLSIADVDQAKAKQLANEVGAQGFAASEFLPLIAGADLVINATPLGMHPHEDKTPLTDLSVILARQLYSDIVYVPQDTLFLRNAQNKGAQVHYGWGMLLYQGVIGFSYHTGIPLTDVPVDIMKKALLGK